MGCSVNYFSESLMPPFSFVLLHQLLWAELLNQARWCKGNAQMREVEGTPADAHRVIPLLGSLGDPSKTEPEAVPCPGLTQPWWFVQGALPAELQDIPWGAGSRGCLLAVALHWCLAAPLSGLGKTAEKTLLQQSVVSDRLQRLLQPKLLKWVLPKNPLFSCWEHCMAEQEKGDVEISPSSSKSLC